MVSGEEDMMILLIERGSEDLWYVVVLNWNREKTKEEYRAHLRD